MLKPEDITIAVTVYSRAEYVLDAIQSALAQTVRARVMVVEDCGPNPNLQRLVQERFGNRITYYRNEKNRGLFDNWNACMEYCQTPWISILHDDDFLRPGFVAAMVDLERMHPDAGIYFGRSAMLEHGRISPPPAVDWKHRKLELADFAQLNSLLFPGQLFRVADAQAHGGFRPHSWFTGDWEMWFKLGLRGGIAQTAEEVSVVRSHIGKDRGTSKVERLGRRWALDHVQVKRNLRLLAQAEGRHLSFNRREVLKKNPVRLHYLLNFADKFPPRMLVYNYKLFLDTPPPRKVYALLQSLVACLGPAGLRLASTFWNKCCRA